jgi:hypothetical protein
MKMASTVMMNRGEAHTWRGCTGSRAMSFPILDRP